ncbi:MAG: hypothetical protein CMM82_01185 [Rhodospirillales bacterium]|nr:hypothetical protein [Rhodospirillales bacterium]
MEKPKITHILAGTATISLPILVLLIFLVGIEELAFSSAIIAGFIGIITCIIIITLQTLRIKKIQNFVEKDLVLKELEIKQTAFDAGSGPIGELISATLRVERKWINERKTLKAGLLSAANLFDALPDPLVTLDHQARLVYANAAARTLLAENKPDIDLRGNDISSILRQPLVLEAVQDVLDGAKTRYIEFKFAEKIELTFEARIEAISAADKEENDAVILLLLRDVTSQKLNEESRADFVANVSHELRTPLTSLIGFIETLRESAKNDPNARERFLSLMATQSDRMARLVNDLLSLSRIEMNVHDNPAKSVDLRKVIETVIDMLAPQAKQRSITIEADLRNITSPIIGDSDELLQLFQNLIENSIKYANKKSIVRITSNCNIKACSISVIDESNGIPREHITRLTERFYRIDTARSRELGGTGLGLAIVKHIVNRHRGKLKIESVEGQGSTFSVSLPISEETNL